MSKMRVFKIFCMVILGGVAGSAGLHGDDIGDLINRARAAIGGDDALNRVITLRMEGDLNRVNRTRGEDGSIQIRNEAGRFLNQFARTDIDFRSRQETIWENRTQVQVLNGYTGWAFTVIQRDREQRPNFQALGSEAVFNMQVNAAEQIGFFHGYRELFGTVEDLGTSQYEGQTVRGVRFRYDNNLYIDRFFNPSTGELVYSRDGNGVRIIPSGEQVVEGVKFPTTLTYFRDGDQIGEDTIRRVVVNPTLSPRLFAFPNSVFSPEGINIPAVIGQGSRSE